MKSERSWAGIICGFVLFIVVCLSLLLHMKGAFRASGNPELGLLFFLLPGAAASCLSPGQRVLRPLLGAKKARWRSLMSLPCRPTPRIKMKPISSLTI